jgi:type VI secretion system protein ImpJ
MSWYSKVVWGEGIFLRPHHLQQHDRYLEHLVDTRTRHVSPYPWGFSALEIDHDLAQQAKFSVRRAAGIMPDGTPFNIPGDSPLATAISVPDQAQQQTIWLNMPLAAANTREVDSLEVESASRFFKGAETLVDSTASLRIDEEIDVAFPRLTFEMRKGAKPGFASLAVARIIEVRDRVIVFDGKFAPPILTCSASDVVTGWLDRVIGWIETKLEQLARYAADPTAGGGLQSADYLMLQLLNRNIVVLQHLRNSVYVHPERLYCHLVGLAGELATFTNARRAKTYPAYDHDDLQNVFAPVLSDIQEFLDAQVRRAIRLELIARAQNAYISPIRDPSLFRNATFVLEVSANRPLGEIQMQFPNLLKLGPSSKMNEIVHANLPGVPLVHLPTPPVQIRAITSHVYFYLDKKTPLWPDFSQAKSIGLHFAGDWPQLELELWAVVEGRT